MNIRKYFLLLCACLSLWPTVQAQVPDTDSVSVAMATIFGDIVRRNLDSFRHEGVQLNDQLFAEKFVQALQDRPTGMSLNRANEIMQEVVSHSAPTDTISMAQQKALLDEARATEGAVVLPSGTVFIVVTEGEGTKPGAHDIASVSYVGRLADGSIFDVADQPIDLPLDNLITGFSEGISQMLPGGTYRIVIPAEAAYGAHGVPGAIPPGATLDFTVTLNSSRPADR